MTKAEMVEKFGPMAARYEKCRADAAAFWDLLLHVGDGVSRMLVLRNFWNSVNVALETAAELIGAQQEELEKHLEEGGLDG